jgi:hypothetical protein
MASCITCLAGESGASGESKPCFRADLQAGCDHSARYRRGLCRYKANHRRLDVAVMGKLIDDAASDQLQTLRF